MCVGLQTYFLKLQILDAIFMGLCRFFYIIILKI